MCYHIYMHMHIHMHMHMLHRHTHSHATLPCTHVTMHTCLDEVVMLSGLCPELLPYLVNREWHMVKFIHSNLDWFI